MSLELQRYGRGPDGFPYILTAFPDGYWTPWHLADQQIRRLETRVEELEAGQAVGEAEDLRREVDGLRDLLHRMLEAPTTQVSVTWKDAVREALGSEAGQPAAQADAQPVAPLLLKGIGKINGDGWKDTTRIGDVVYAWNCEMPEPYAPGQFPRLGNPIWSASTQQYDFRAVPNAELSSVVDQVIEELRAEVGKLKDELAAAPPAPQPEADAQLVAPKPDGRLHQDGYFTWARRDGYAMDRRLPCDFYLQPAAAPPARQPQPLTDEHVQRVVRSVQPHLDIGCKAWRELEADCRAWLEAERGIGREGE